MKSGLWFGGPVRPGACCLPAPAEAQGRQDRHFERSVRRLRRLRRQVVGRSGQDGGSRISAASVLGQKIEVISADHQNKPDLGVAIGRRWYEVENVDISPN